MGEYWARWETGTVLKLRIIALSMEAWTAVLARRHVATNSAEFGPDDVRAYRREQAKAFRGALTIRGLRTLDMVKARQT